MSDYGSDMYSDGYSSPASLAPDYGMNVVVTGGSSGIGKSVVESFARQGHRVLFSYLSNRTGVDDLQKRFSNVTPVRLDQGMPESVKEFAEAVRAWLSRSPRAHLDVLINNAALGSATVSQYCQNDAESEMLDEALMRVNALGPLWVTRALLPLCQPDLRAVIIFLGSVGGGSAAVFPEYRPSDLMSKAAVTYLAKHIAAEHVHTEIDVICISPGATETEMFRKSTLDKVPDPKKFVKQMPKGALIQPDHIAEQVYFLATCPGSRMFHGAVIDASMGLAVRPGLQTEAR